ncbi:MAG: glycine--tRNA ligase subunit beta, partial [Ramlibacter sp.]
MPLPNLLVELFVEELPPKALKKLGEAFSNVLFNELGERDLTSAESLVTSYASPRRLAAHITAVRSHAPDHEVIERLMPFSVAIKDGKATDALRKRLAKEGRGHLADLWPNARDGSDELVVQNDGKADSVYLRGMAVGSSLLVGLLSALEQSIAKLPIPKVMTYQLDDGWTDVKFVRPAHSLIALHGNEVVPVSVLGLEAGNTTHGHRFEAAVDPIRIEHADSYAQSLEKDGAVIAGFEARRAEIVRQLADAAAKVGGGAKVIEDEALLDEVTALVERPNVLVCQFDKEFLEVPQECLIL